MPVCPVLRLVPTIAVVLILSSCGSGSSAGNGVGASDFSTQWCELFSPCCAHEGYEPSGQRCKDVVATLTSETGATDAMMGNCLAAVKSKEDLPEFCYLPLQGDTEVCVDVLVSPARVEQKEADDQQHEKAKAQQKCAAAPECCTSGVFCSSPDTYCEQGTGCLPRIAVGEPCAYLACVAEGYCDAVSATCASRKPLAATCLTSPECIAGTYCNAAKVCAEQVAYGGTCDTSDACPGSCDSTSICTGGNTHGLFCGAKLDNN
jgi:hypothetical protein